MCRTATHTNTDEGRGGGVKSGRRSEFMVTGKLTAGLESVISVVLLLPAGSLTEPQSV